MFNIDMSIFIGFLIANLLFGLFHSKGIKNIKEYAIGNRNFSTATIISTLIATWISGESFFSYVTESYTHGLYIIWACVAGEVLSFFIIGYIFAPRLAECLGSLSVAELMGNLYGKSVRIVVAAIGVLGMSGFIAVQLKIAGILLEYCFGISGIYSILLGGGIITIYSTVGGIKSVTFTDLIQFFTFGAIVPIIVYFISTTIDYRDIAIHATTNPLFDYRQVFDFTQPKSLYYLFLFLFIAIPGFNPTIFQRIAMAKDLVQVKKSFVITGFICLFLSLMMAWVGVLVMFATGSTIEPADAVRYVLFNYSSVGFKGLIVSGIMAMVMSTVDSCINSISVLLTNDFCKPLGIKIRNELLFARVSSLLIGTLAIFLAVKGSGSLMRLQIAANMLYMPIVTVPFIMSFLGFRSTGKSVLIGMGSGAVMVIIWETFFKAAAAGIDGILPGMLANLIAYMGSHYLLRQTGGWVGIKDGRYLAATKNQRRLKIKKFLLSIKNFNIIELCKTNSPKTEGAISMLGFFIMISSFGSTQTLAQIDKIRYESIIDILYPITLFSASILVSYPLWLDRWKRTNIINIFWNIIMFLVLICSSFLMVLISRFSEIQLVAFMVNLNIIFSFSKWRWSLLNIIVGITIVSYVYYQYYLPELVQVDGIISKFELVYLLLLVSSSLVLFFKPQQEQQELVLAKNVHLGFCLRDKDKTLSKALKLKYELLENLAHEGHTPLTGVTSMGEALLSGYDRLTDKQIKEGLKVITKSSDRLLKFVNNLVDVSKLNSMKYDFDKTKVNLTDLLYEHLEFCKRLYLEQKELIFITDIKEDIFLECDKYYIGSCLDNLIINAIKYSHNNTMVTLTLKKINQEIEFTFVNEGPTIPEHELHDIFEPFIVGSHTRTPNGEIPNGQRGMGLTLCKAVIKAHKGKIWVQNTDNGVIFGFTLPIL